MADSDSATSSPVGASLSSLQENVVPVTTTVADLNKSSSELLTRIQGLKQDLQSWRSRLDTQVKVYHNELTQLKKSLNVEVEQLRSEFQELRSTLQQQQEDVTVTLRNLGMQDGAESDSEMRSHGVEMIAAEGGTQNPRVEAIVEEGEPRTLENGKQTDD